MKTNGIIFSQESPLQKTPLPCSCVGARYNGWLKRVAFIIVLIATLSRCAHTVYDLPSAPCTGEESGRYAQSAEVKSLMGKLVQNVPGAAIAVWTDDGLWEYSAGYAKIETKTPMRTCHLQYLQSVSKTYAAVCLLKLVEQGKVDLHAPITAYLLPAHSQSVTRAKEITVEMLLNHTSGIPEYNATPRYITRLLQNPDHPFHPVDYLTYIKGKPLDFEPGSKYSYRNTNYLLLALMLDAITGNHGQFMEREIFEPLHLKDTYYYTSTGYLGYNQLVNTYWDRYSNGRIENISNLQRNNVQALVGDDGIVSTPGDAVRFLRGLMTGELIHDKTLAQMKTWVNDAGGNATYGLGLDRAMLGKLEGVGHSGGGLGAGCQLYFLPEKNLYYFIAINLGTVTESPIHAEVGRQLEALVEILQR